MKELRILSELGSNENPSLLCEIPQSWTQDIEINTDGSVNCLSMLKVLKRAFMEEAVNKNRKEPLDTDGQKDPGPKETVGRPTDLKAAPAHLTQCSTVGMANAKEAHSAQHNKQSHSADGFYSSVSHQSMFEALKKTPLYEMIFNPAIAIDPEGCP